MIIRGDVLPKKYYCRNPSEVARDLLGKLLVRDYRGIRLSGVIVETEAYFGIEDPASRARRGGDLRRTLYGECGLALIYGIHTHWMLNVVAHEEGGGGAVLIRAIEPVEGIEVMSRLRGITGKPYLLTSGPGRLSKALGISKSLHKAPVYIRRREGIWIEDVGLIISEDEVIRTGRVGVSEDLPEPFRYVVKSSRFASKVKSRLRFNASQKLLTGVRPEEQVRHIRFRAPSQ